MTCKFANKTIRSSIKQPEHFKMESSFWKEVWNEGQIGFHQSEINKNLKICTKIQRPLHCSCSPLW